MILCLPSWLFSHCCFIFCNEWLHFRESLLDISTANSNFCFSKHSCAMWPRVLFILLGWQCLLLLTFSCGIWNPGSLHMGWNLCRMSTTSSFFTQWHGFVDGQLMAWLVDPANSVRLLMVTACGSFCWMLILTCGIVVLKSDRFYSCKSVNLCC